MWNTLWLHDGYLFAATVGSDCELKLVRYRLEEP